MDERLQRDREACRALIRHGSKSFYAASLLLPKRIRDGAYALYAFCRVSDDTVDVEDGSQDAIDHLTRRLEKIYAGRPAAHPVDRSFAHVVSEHEIPLALPAALIEGLAWDVHGRRYADLGALYDYAARVAGSVGAMMALLMGARSRDAIARACDLGAGMQLTNIARDIGEDARNGRIYLPMNWLVEAGVDPEAWLARPELTPEIAAVTQRLLAAAEACYDAGLAGLDFLPRDCRPGILAAGRIYAQIGERIARNGYDSISQRAVVSTGRKVFLAALAVLDSEWLGDRPDAPPMKANRFLVDAAAKTNAAPAPAVSASQTGFFHLLDRLEKRDHAIVEASRA